MVDDRKSMKWHPMNEIKATAVTSSTATPNMVCSIPLSALPPGIQQMAGLTSAYVSSYITMQPAPGGVSAHGEFAVVRFDGVTGKGYNYVFGISSNNMVYFAGPFKNIPAHHFQTSAAIPISSLFVGHTNRGAK